MMHRSRSDHSRRRLEPSARRAELLDAAVRVLRSHGPGQSRVEDVTREARTAKGNFYRYFSSWDELLVAVRDHLLDHQIDGFSSRMAGRKHADWWEALEQEVDSFLEFHIGMGRGLHQAIFHGPAAEQHPVDSRRSLPHLVARFLRDGCSEGAFAEVDVEQTSALLFHLLHGAADEIWAGADREKVRQAMLHVVRRTLERVETALDHADSRSKSTRPRMKGHR
jgi:AcrR family transcriptional regulator